VVCERRLDAGDQFALTPDDRLYCRDHIDSTSDVTSAESSYDATPLAAVTSTDDDVTTGISRQLNNNNENETKSTISNASGESL